MQEEEARLAEREEEEKALLMSTENQLSEVHKKCIMLAGSFSTLFHFPFIFSICISL